MGSVKTFFVSRRLINPGTQRIQAFGWLEGPKLSCYPLCWTEANVKPEAVCVHSSVSTK